MIKRERPELSANRCGGKGSVTVNVLMDKQDLNGKGMGVTRIVIPPGSSIGSHEHRGGSEQYYVLSGSGLFDDNGTAKAISSGETGAISPGQRHGIENTGTEDMIVIAVHTFE